MPTPTVATLPDRPRLDYELAADVVARMLDTAARVPAEVAVDRVGALSVFLADADLLSRIIARGCDHGDLEEIVDRLWMVAR